VILELPLNLQTIAPGHQPNWDLVSDFVSSGYSKHFRNALECKKRFENFILKREEMCLSEIQNKKQMLLQQKQQQEQQSGGGVKMKQPPKPMVID
jgi:E1A-binding protein p400